MNEYTIETLVIRPDGDRDFITTSGYLTFEDCMEDAIRLVNEYITGLKQINGTMVYTLVHGETQMGIIYYDEEHEFRLDVRMFDYNDDVYRKFLIHGTQVGTTGKHQIINI